MISPHRALRIAFALGLAGVMAPPAFAQTNYLAVAEVVGGGSQGRVEIFSQSGSTPTLFATVSGIANPYGLAFNSATNDLYISSLGSNQIYDYNLNTSTVSSVINIGTTGHYNPNSLVISGGSLYVSASDGNTVASPGAVLQYSLSNLGGGPTATYSGNGLVAPTGLAVNGSTVYVNSSKTDGLYSLATATPTPVTFDSVPSAPAGLLFGTQGSTTFVYEASAFANQTPSTHAQGIDSYQLSGTSATLAAQTSGGFNNNPYAGGPAGIIAGISTNQIFVSDYGDGLIYQYTANSNGSLTSDGTYLTLTGGAAPVYMAEISTSVVFHSPAPVPEPSSVALLGLGAAVGLVARRRLRRAKSAV